MSQLSEDASSVGRNVLLMRLRRAEAVQPRLRVCPFCGGVIICAVLASLSACSGPFSLRNAAEAASLRMRRSSQALIAGRDYLTRSALLATGRESEVRHQDEQHERAYDADEVMRHTFLSSI